MFKKFLLKNTNNKDLNTYLGKLQGLLETPNFANFRPLKEITPITGISNAKNFLNTNIKTVIIGRDRETGVLNQLLVETPKGVFQCQPDLLGALSHPHVGTVVNPATNSYLCWTLTHKPLFRFEHFHIPTGKLSFLVDNSSRRDFIDLKHTFEIVLPATYSNRQLVTTNSKIHLELFNELNELPRFGLFTPTPNAAIKETIIKNFNERYEIIVDDLPTALQFLTLHNFELRNELVLKTTPDWYALLDLNKNYESITGNELQDTLLKQFSIKIKDPSYSNCRIFFEKNTKVFKKFSALDIENVENSGASMHNQIEKYKITKNDSINSAENSDIPL